MDQVVILLIYTQEVTGSNLDRVLPILAEVTGGFVNPSR
jgi:hypothetical protein